MLALATTFYNAALAAKPVNIGDVRVLNLYSNANYTGVRQDQLYLMVPRSRRSWPRLPRPWLGRLGQASDGLRI